MPTKKPTAEDIAKTLSDKQKTVVRAASANGGTTVEALKNQQCDARNINPLITKKLVAVTKKGVVTATAIGRKVAQAA